jgi:hypothetical protein
MGATPLPAAWEASVAQPGGYAGEVTGSTIHNFRSYLRSDALALSWCTEQLEEPKRFFTTVERLVNHDFAEARGPEGQPGSPEALVRVAREIASACLRAREWGAWILRAQGSAKLTAAVRELAQTIDEPVREVEKLGARIVDSTESALRSEPGSPARHIKLTIELRLTNEQALSKALKALTEPPDPLREDA